MQSYLTSAALDETTGGAGHDSTLGGVILDADEGRINFGDITTSHSQISQLNNENELDDLDGGWFSVCIIEVHDFPMKEGFEFLKNCRGFVECVLTMTRYCIEFIIRTRSRPCELVIDTISK